MSARKEKGKNVSIPGCMCLCLRVPPNPSLSVCVCVCVCLPARTRNTAYLDVTLGGLHLVQPPDEGGAVVPGARGGLRVEGLQQVGTRHARHGHEKDV